ncbi:MAG TPA: spore germination protein GerW family protein [Ktedonobacteraceae bacterium]|nr:spore germination protein GerW family protein [Ktedonobacteraceae bacterium]
MIEEQKATRPATTNQTIEQALNQLVSAAKADAVFGQPVERGNATVIPCSEVSVGMGLGSGSGPIDEKGNSMGGGYGMGGGANGRPIAAIIITGEDVRVEPIMDMTKVVLAALSTGAFMLFWLGRLSRVDSSGKRASLKQFRKAIGG